MRQHFIVFQQGPRIFLKLLALGATSRVDAWIPSTWQINVIEQLFPNLSLTLEEAPEPESPSSSSVDKGPPVED